MIIFVYMNMIFNGAYSSCISMIQNAWPQARKLSKFKLSGDIKCERAVDFRPIYSLAVGKKFLPENFQVLADQICYGIF